MAKKVLVIDDDSQTRNTLRYILESLHCKVYEASNGREGIASFRKNPAGVVITDIFMPEIDGLETIKFFSKEFPEIKIVAISSYDMNHMDYFEAATLFGAAHCLRKPLSVEDIKGVVEQ